MSSPTRTTTPINSLALQLQQIGLRAVPADLDDFLEFTDLKFDVDPDIGVHGDHHVGIDKCMETRRLHAHLVMPGNQVALGVIAGFVRHSSEDRIAVIVTNSDGCASQK